MPHHLDFFGSGVDTVWAVPMGSVLDPATILRTAGIAGTVPARPPPIDPKSRKSASGAATGRQGVSEIRVYDG